jgi:hypothetical protein
MSKKESELEREDLEEQKNQNRNFYSEGEVVENDIEKRKRIANLINKIEAKEEHTKVKAKMEG